MKIAILGSGGREHALAFSISNSKQTKEIYFQDSLVFHL